MHEYEAETNRVKKVKFKGKALLIFWGKKESTKWWVLLVLTLTKRRDLIASCVGDINTICYPFLLALFGCYKNVLSLHCHLHTFLLVFAFCLAHPMSQSHHLKIPSISLQTNKIIARDITPLCHVSI